MMTRSGSADLTNLELNLIWVARAWLSDLSTSFTAWLSFIALEDSQYQANASAARALTLIFLLRHKPQPVLDLPILPITIGRSGGIELARNKRARLAVESQLGKRRPAQQVKFWFYCGFQR